MSEPVRFLDGRATLYSGDCREVVVALPEASIDAIVTDPPYELGFMGKGWDKAGVAFKAATWAEAMRILKPGGHMFAFGGTRTYHRLACAIEDAGFEIRDQFAWVYGSGFPKSLDVSKAIDRAAGAEREDKFEGSFTRRAGPTGNKRCDECGKWLVSGSPCQCPRPQDEPQTPEAQRWKGWGTAAKPAWEPICLARKPLIGTVAENVLAYGTGALNIDACRVGTDLIEGTRGAGGQHGKYSPIGAGSYSHTGRWPANLVHDGSEEVLAAFPRTASGTGAVKKATAAGHQNNAYGKESRPAGTPNVEYGDEGSAARFFYAAKADADDRIGSKHPTVKPVDLMRWLCRLITPPGGTILDPFAGTGTTGEAAYREGFSAVLIEREAEYRADIERRMRLCMAGPDERRRESIKAKMADKPIDAGPLFGDAA